MRDDRRALLDSDRRAEIREDDSVSPDRSLQPVAMERSLRIIDEALGTLQTQVTLPCDAVGAQTS
jgi:hypothetical protein